MRYGVTPSYELGESTSSLLTSSHQILLEELDDLQTYEVELRSTDALGNTTANEYDALLGLRAGPKRRNITTN